MKLNGIKVAPVNERQIPVVRGNEVYYFIARPIDSYDTFNALCPEPKMDRQGRAVGEAESKPIPSNSYKEQLAQYNKNLINYMFLATVKTIIIRKQEIVKSEDPFTLPTIKDIQTTVPIEWETVDMDEPETWDNWHAELKEWGLNNIELLDLQRTAQEVNSINEDAVQRALQNFLAKTAEEVDPSFFFKEEAGFTVSTEPASASMSDLPE